MAAEEKSAAPAPEAAKAAGGGFKAFLPLILTVVLLPVLAWATTTFLLIPKIKASLGTQSAHAREGGEGAPATEGAAAEPTSVGKPKHKQQMSKLVVNVSGSGGSRLLLVSLTVAGNAGNFRALIDDNMDQLRDIASGVMASKTITDLERPDSRTILRSELLSQFNAALGDGVVTEIYITEMAIQ